MSNLSQSQEVRHTPGPWEVSHRGVPNEYGVFHDGLLVASVPVPLNLSRKEAHASARLIAAAPELFEALKELSEMYSHAWDLADGGLVMMDSSIPRFEAAHAKAADAIAKAEGRNV